MESPAKCIASHFALSSMVDNLHVHTRMMSTVLCSIVGHMITSLFSQPKVCSSFRSRISILCLCARHHYAFVSIQLAV